MSDEPMMRFGAGDVWFWTSDSNGIPDHPPVHLGKVTGEALAPEAPLTFGVDYQLGPPVPLTLDDLGIDSGGIRDWTAQGPDAGNLLDDLIAARDMLIPPRIRRLEVGPGVADYLRRTAPAPASPIPPDLSAIPIVETHGIPPGGWRIVDQDGEVRTAGLIPDADREGPQTSGGDRG